MYSKNGLTLTPQAGGANQLHSSHFKDREMIQRDQ